MFNFNDKNSENYVKTAMNDAINEIFSFIGENYPSYKLKNINNNIEIKNTMDIMING